MAQSFLQRLFGQKNRGRDAPSLGLTPASDVARQANLKSRGPDSQVQNSQPMPKVNSLFAFVDFKDPFAPGEIAGEDLPGPILSIMGLKQFGSLFLFHTPHTRESAFSTKAEVSHRYPECRVAVHELPVSDPKDYSALMGRLSRLVRKLLRLPRTGDNYVCVSSGTAEMRAIWILLTGLGILPAKLIQVGSPTRSLFGAPNVKDVQIDTSDWPTIRDLALPAEYFAEHAGDIASSLVREESKAGVDFFAFDKTYLERLRDGDPATGLHFAAYFEQLLRIKLRSRILAPDKVEDLRRETSTSIVAALREKGGVRQPEHFGALVNSICNKVLLDHYRSSAKTQPMEGSQGPASETGELRLTRKHLETLRRAKEPLRDETVRKEPTEAAKEEASEATEEAPATGEEDKMFYMGELPELKSLTVSEPSVRLARETLAVPGLDDALLELGIYVGSAVLRHAAERAGIAAGSHLPVLLLGDTGTGKERFAHLIHRLSPRFPCELVAINCAAIPEPIAESYLFGHMRGAFTGADRDKKGMFESADQSTLFLDEVAELTLEMQAKLLRVIQDGVVQRLGSTTPKKVDVRIVAASNRDLRKEVSAGRFREDLYFRLEVVQIKLPALRERRSEIPELAIALLRQINLRRHKPRQLSSAALMRLEQYHWPGNVRQLSNVLERSVLFALADIIQVEDLDIIEEKPCNDPFVPLPEPSPGFKVDVYMTQVREQLFLRALAACKGNQTEAAERLGVSKQAVSKFVAGQNDNVD
jgi:transcriptional regulator with PAS, ATPase and Fis domain